MNTKKGVFLECLEETLKFIFEFCRIRYLFDRNKNICVVTFNNKCHSESISLKSIKPKLRLTAIAMKMS